MPRNFLGKKKDTGVRAKSNLIDIFNLLLTWTSQKDQSKNLFFFFQSFVKSFLYNNASAYFFLVWGTLIISEHWFRKKTLKLLKKKKSNDTLLLRSLVRLLIGFKKMKFLSKSRWERKHCLDPGIYLVFSFLKPEEILCYLVWAPQIKALVISSGFSGLKGIDKRRTCLGNLIWVIGSMEPSRKQITVNRVWVI